jgi:hypothetical protein
LAALRTGFEVVGASLFLLVLVEGVFRLLGARPSTTLLVALASRREEYFLSLPLTCLFFHMAPLDRFTYTPVPSETYVTFHNNDWGKDYYILSQRDVIVGTHPFYELEASPAPSTSTSSSQAQAASFQAIMDLFTENLCLCPRHQHNQQRMSARPQRAAVESNALSTPPAPIQSQHRENILYPVARYPDRLNNPALVQQRRMSLRSYSTFVPVVVE